MKLNAGDSLEFENGVKYTVPTTGNYCVVGKIHSFNGVPLKIQWSGVAKDEDEAINRAIAELQSRMTTPNEKL